MFDNPTDNHTDIEVPLYYELRFTKLKINNGGRLLIFYMMEGIKKVNWKNGILWLFSVTDPPKIQDGRQI